MDFDLVADISMIDLRRYKRVRPVSEYAADLVKYIIEQIEVRQERKVTKIEVEARKYNGRMLEDGESSDRCDEGYVIVELH